MLILVVLLLLLAAVLIAALVRAVATDGYHRTPHNLGLSREVSSWSWR